MTQEEFIKVLDTKGYSYEIEGDKLVVTSEVSVHLSALTSLPPGVEFKNEGHVRLRSLTSLPPGVKFNNEGDVALNSLDGGWVDEWSGNIKGIESKRLLNLTIKQGMFI